MPNQPTDKPRNKGGRPTSISDYKKRVRDAEQNLRACEEESEAGCPMCSGAVHQARRSVAAMKAVLRKMEADKPKNKGGRPRKIDLEEAVRMRREGKTFREIADALGASFSAVRGLMAYNGYDTRPHFSLSCGKHLDSGDGEGEESLIVRADEGSKG